MIGIQCNPIKTRDILLSIKPEYVKQIMNGTKKYEFRKRIPKDVTSIDRVYIYCTAPVSKVVGYFVFDTVLKGCSSDLWMNTVEYSGISVEDFMEYFKGCILCYAYRISRVVCFDEPYVLPCHPPQDFMYMTMELRVKMGLDDKCENHPICSCCGRYCTDCRLSNMIGYFNERIERRLI